MIFGINGTSDISKLLYVISRAVRRVKFETILNITSGIYAKYHIQIMLLFVYTTTCKWFVIFPCRYFKISWNTTAQSRSNCRNFSCSSITIWMHRSQFHFFFCTKNHLHSILRILMKKQLTSLERMRYRTSRPLSTARVWESNSLAGVTVVVPAVRKWAQCYSQMT